MEGNSDVHIWNSPDGLINKRVFKNGEWGPKPTENCECYIAISNVTKGTIDVEKYNNAAVVIGDIDTAFGRLLDICLQMMHSGELSNVQFNLDKPVQFTLELKSFQSKGLIYEWSAKEKFDLAFHHKTRGVALFNTNVSDASHHFSKGLKLLASIPIEIDDPPVEKDGVELREILKLKVNLYNNLASCYLRAKEFDHVIYLCQKVLAEDRDNEKALYKIGVAYYEVHEFEQANSCIKQLLEIDPDNKPASDKLKMIKVKLDEENLKSKDMVRRMFGITRIN